MQIRPNGWQFLQKKKGEKATVFGWFYWLATGRNKEGNGKGAKDHLVSKKGGLGSFVVLCFFK